MDNLDESKHSNAAMLCVVHTKINHIQHCLLLYRKKWESEGTPFILPGGIVKPGEHLIDTAWRELFEETGLTQSDISQTAMGKEIFSTHWTLACHHIWMRLGTSQRQRTRTVYPKVKFDRQKFCGYIWFPLEKVSPLYWARFATLVMPGSRRIIALHLYNE